MAKEKYRIVRNILYRGVDGKNKKSVSIGPGEDVPKLDTDRLEGFLRTGAIVTVDGYGENVPYRKTEEWTDAQIDNLLNKKPPVIASVVRATSFSENTLGKIYAEAEKKHFSPKLLELIEVKISGI